MAINDFEALSVLMYAVKNKKYNIRQIKNHADLRIFNSKENNVIEIKASMTNGNPIKRVVSQTEITRANNQLNKYEESFHKTHTKYYVLTSYGAIKSPNKDKNDIDIYDIKSVNGLKNTDGYRYIVMHYKKPLKTSEIRYSSDMTKLGTHIVDEVERRFSVNRGKARDFVNYQSSIIKNDTTGVIIYNQKSMMGLIEGKIDKNKLNNFAIKEKIDFIVEEDDIEKWIESEISYVSHAKEVNSETIPIKQYEILLDSLELIIDERERKTTALIICFWMEE